ncbi:MAG: PilZ domain-containing protein [Desulfobacca sp.]|uniref:PilZ domain-containing protein n=1 Tax=Desulfobacca sp. TaxID=2067990 RepID=UPI0040499EB2
MTEQKKTAQKSPGPSDEKTVLEARKTRNYFIKRELLKKIFKKQADKRQPAPYFQINRELLEVNGKPGNGAQVLNFAINGARLRLPFSPPLMSQIRFKFTLQSDARTHSIAGQVIWSQRVRDKDWYEVEVQFYQNYWEIDQLLRLAQR